MKRVHTTLMLLLVVAMTVSACGRSSPTISTSLPSATEDINRAAPTSASVSRLAGEKEVSPVTATPTSSRGLETAVMVTGTPTPESGATVAPTGTPPQVEAKATATASPGGSGSPIEASWGEGSGGRLGYDDGYISAPEVAEQAAALGYDPARLFAFVRDEIAFESYSGILRGALGTLWGRAGNAADQSVLLYSLLRESSVEARFARGSLADADARALLKAMFTPPLEFGMEDVPPSGIVADPLNDPILLTETRDHLWIQMLSESVWVDLDPSFSGAQEGDRRAEPSATFTRPPDDLYHRLGIRVRLERITEDGLVMSYPLEYEGRVADMAGRKMSYGHVLEQLTGPQGVEAVSIGRVIGAQQRRYKPALTVAGKAVIGQAFTEAEGLDLDAPVGRMAQALGSEGQEAGPLSAEWLEFTMISPDGSTQVSEREVFDRLGPDARESGDLERLDRIDMNELLLGTYLSLFVAPGRLPTAVAQAELAKLQPLAIEHENLQRRLDLVRAEGAESEVRKFVIESLLPFDFQLWMELAHATNLMMAASADESLGDMAALLGVRRYYDSPRIFVTELKSLSDATGSLSLDLRCDSIRVLAYPGQDMAAELAFNTIRGIFEASLEGRVLSAVTGQPALTAAVVFAESEAQGIKPAVLTPDNRAALAGLAVTKDVRARIGRSLDAGYGIVMPERLVPLPAFGGEPRSAWWRVDQDTGEVVGVLDSGLHQSLTFYENVILNMYMVQWGSAFGGKDVSTMPVDLLVGADSILWKYAAEVLKNVDHVRPWAEVQAAACSETVGSIVQTATEIGIATRKSEAVATFMAGAYMGVALVCP